MMCFGKKTQVCGFCSNDKINLADDNVFKKSGRINSTWGGNIIDMERARLIIEVMIEENIVNNAAVVGDYFLKKLQETDLPDVSNVRGKGLMIAFDLPDETRRNKVIDKMHDLGLLSLKSGSRSIRFRPALTFKESDVDWATDITKKSLS